jgi:predicted porin
MNKKLLIAAVGAALVAGPMLAAQADTTVYGHFHESLDHYDNGGSPSTEKSLLNSDSSRFGIKGNEDLGGGLKTIYQVESGIFGADDGSGGATAGQLGFGGQLRNTYLGFAGSSWGSVKFGRHDTPVKDMSRKIDAFNEEIGDLRNGIGYGLFDNRVSNMMRYDSPSFAGVQFGLLYGASEVNTDVRTTSSSVTWTQGPIYLGLGYEVQKAHSSALKDASDMRLVGMFNVTSDFYLAAIYDNVSNISGTDGNDGKTWGIGGGFKMANNLLKLQYANVDKTDKAATDNGAKFWVVGVDHNFSKTTKLYFDYAKVKNADGAAVNISSSTGGHGVVAVPAVPVGKDPKGYSLGMVVNF